MKKAIFIGPIGDDMVVSDIERLKNKIVNEFEFFWMQGSGDGFIDFYEDDKKISTLLIGPNTEYGLYLHFIDNIKCIDLLSLNNEYKLEEVVETAEEIYASIGLFLPVEIAWEGILEFIETGKPSSKIKWITPDKIPENGNW